MYSDTNIGKAYALRVEPIYLDNIYRVNLQGLPYNIVNSGKQYRLYGEDYEFVQSSINPYNTYTFIDSTLITYDSGLIENYTGDLFYAMQSFVGQFSLPDINP